MLFKDGLFQWKRLENLILLAREQVTMINRNTPLQHSKKGTRFTWFLSPTFVYLFCVTCFWRGAQLLGSDESPNYWWSWMMVGLVLNYFLLSSESYPWILVMVLSRLLKR